MARRRVGVDSIVRLPLLTPNYATIVQAKLSHSEVSEGIYYTGITHPRSFSQA